MSEAQASRWILVAGAVMLTTGFVAALREDRRLPSVRVPIATLAVMMFLALIREASPRFAGGLAVLITVSTALAGGLVWRAVETAATGENAAPVTGRTNPTEPTTHGM